MLHSPGDRPVLLPELAVDHDVDLLKSLNIELDLNGFEHSRGLGVGHRRAIDSPHDGQLQTPTEPLEDLPLLDDDSEVVARDKHDRELACCPDGEVVVCDGVRHGGRDAASTRWLHQSGGGPDGVITNQ